LVDLLVDDLLTEEILEDDKVLFGQDGDVSGEWNNGVDNITADDHLTEDGEEVELSEEEGLVDF
jgi:hypothetical protein